ncbi:AAA family ATPase [Candidatus Electronema sp. JC]|uniref:AAA family ATPase n=1 Tax=Candidatus Electronema sp. JC TaxID=3401570 RepID=UPI003AA8C3CE
MLILSLVIFAMPRLYIWLPELLWMCILKLWPGKAEDKLPWLPPQFDQSVEFPLPFLHGLIAAAYCENQAAARQSINYLITSTNQQKTASKAMLLIAAESFAACRSAGDIAAVREQLDWLPNELAGKITDCLELSQDTAAALEASSPYRQAQRLEHVCAKIEQRRNALASASAREATTLGGVLDQWQGILRTACRTLHETAKRSGELLQVYLPGPPLEPGKAGSLFKGRKDLFRHIESLLLSAQPPTLVMHGNRRSGKSSALRYLPKQMPSDILPLFVDCQGAAVSSSLHGLADRIAHQLISSARETHRLTLPAPDKEELRLDPFAALLAWLDAAEQAAPGKTFLLCLDEFERIDEIVTTTGSRAPLNFLRHLIQHRRRWLLLFAGEHTPEELSLHWSDCLINTRSLRVSCLDKDDALELIRRPVEDFPEIWQDEAAEAVWQLTQGQPYCIQLIGQEVIERLNKQKRRLAEADDVEAVLPTVFERGSEFFLEFWRSRSKEEQTLLAALAKREIITPDMTAAAPALVRKEILAQEQGGCAFKVPLLGRWIEGL